MEQEKIKSIIESILFVSGEAVSVSKIAKIIGITAEEVEIAVASLREEYGKDKGMIIIRKEQEIQMATNPENASVIDQLIKSEIQENLSKAALEVLAIISYRGPITRVEIEAIRGVNCSFTVRSLMMRGLLERIENPKDNRGYLYKISFDFLRKLGVDSIEKLPDYEMLSKDERIDSIIN
ncbi:MAG: segregation and condensation protein B [uncultured bacterium]|nr:MAG: segregation and condensation protein B [uncultured bacterium]HCU70674.1 SMC-Scp complex subunit ScpB [Candidatus Moranbacteria bacterium]